MARKTKQRLQRRKQRHTKRKQRHTKRKQRRTKRKQKRVNGGTSIVSALSGKNARALGRRIKNMGPSSPSSSKKCCPCPDEIEAEIQRAYDDDADSALRAVEEDARRRRDA